MKSKGILAFAILAIAVCAQSNTIASVIMADLVVKFPNASPTVIQYVMQMGMIGAFPVSLAMSYFTSRFRIKPMILAGLVCIAVGGLAPILYNDNVYFLWCTAFLVGAGQGFLIPLLGTLILTNFEGKTKDTILGLNTAFQSGGAALLLLIAGQIAVRSGWVATFYIYGLTIVVLILAAVFLPLGERPQGAGGADGGPKVRVPAKGLVQSLLGTMCFIGYVTFPINIGMLIAAEGLGDAAATSVAMTLVTLLGALVGLVFRFIIGGLRLYIGTFAALCGFGGMVCAVFAGNIGLIYVSACLLGIFFGSINAGAGYVVGRICKPEEIGPTFSLSMSLVTLGVILSPVIINPITALWTGEMATPRTAFITSAVWFGVSVVLQFIWNSYLTKVTPPERVPEAAAAAQAE